MADFTDGSSGLRDPKNRRMLLIGAGALLALLLLLALWFGNSSQRAQNDVRRANDRVVEKQREVDGARRKLEEKLAELRQVRAEADAQAVRLETRITKDTMARP